jgi:hypothetical protein
LLVHLWWPVQMMVSAQMAGQQLANSNAGAVTGIAGPSLLRQLLGWASFIPLGVVAVIWWPVLFRSKSGPIAAVAALMLAGLSHPAQAYFATQDTVEAVGIPPEATAFWIPDTGDTTQQTQTQDAAFYNSHTVPGKVFFVPHVKLQEPGWFSQDEFIPAGHMILVDRTPVTREWTGNASTGTSVADQSFQCQTDDGLNVQAAVAIAVSIEPQDAATYLYYFGVQKIIPNPDDGWIGQNGNPSDPNSPQAQNDPNVIFSSVFYARPLADVMDSVGHGLVEAAVCKAIGSRSLTQANTDYNKIMDEVQLTAQQYLVSRGITIDYIGWAGTFTFDPDVQTALNNAFDAQTVAPYLTTLNDFAQIQALESKWDGHLPGTLTIVGGAPSAMTTVSGLLGVQASALGKSTAGAPAGQ